MIKFSEIKVGDYLIADNDGDKKQGEVTNLNHDEKQVCVDTGAQEFWYETEQLSPIALDEDQLMKLKFHKQENPDGTVKYMKGAFRMMLPAKGDFSHFELWYRDEHRHIMHPLNVHHLQNHFYEMTKVHLNDESFD
ncbi:MAG TPA: hypothetical protein PLT49_02190 [Ferruginibacter sp.]|jgi:hypothetical protein|nr:hypothetical protein [Ferruginibacter sp.]MBN8699914.1 hypothetical protein [Chitinophagales bacterium]HMW25599.1 hypothetical protein [Ferruginibacter sp.]HMX35842.1 hypothetical protein [Ferruginibacter sp.]HMZ99406.1 hypothetical protein [Ferruginibacter sp.]